MPEEEMRISPVNANLPQTQSSQPAIKGLFD